MNAALSAVSEHLVLVGGMAVGKTTVGRRLAERLDRPFRDSDEDLQRHRGMTSREMARRDGVEALHRAEASQLLDALDSETPSVVAAAASVVEDEDSLRALRPPFVAWLRARPETTARRMAAGSPNSPVGHRRDIGDDPAEALERLEARRAPRYQQVADLSLDVDDLDPDQVAARILAAWARSPSVSLSHALGRPSVMGHERDRDRRERDQERDHPAGGEGMDDRETHPDSR